MKKIFKFPIPTRGENKLAMPRSAQPISAGLDPQGQLCVWAEVDVDKTEQKRDAIFTVYGTGHEMSNTFEQFIGTVLSGPFMWHVYFRWEKH